MPVLHCPKCGSKLYIKKGLEIYTEGMRPLLDNGEPHKLDHVRIGYLRKAYSVAYDLFEKAEMGWTMATKITMKRLC